MSAPSSCCISGHLHTGTPKGTEETVHGLPTYVSPGKQADKSKTVVFLADIFGFQLPNVRLLADEWADQGYYVLVPDIYQGDPIDNSMLNVIVPNLREQARKGAVEKAADTVKMGATFGPWAIKHRDAVTVPIIEGFLKGVRSEPAVKKVVSVGFCFGGRHAILSAGENALVDAAVAFHPAGVAVPAELDVLSKPVLLSIGDKDAMMDMSQVEHVRKVFQTTLAEKRPGDKFEVKVYPNAVHGFAVRGDMEDAEEKKLQEQGNVDAWKFLQEVL